MVEKNPWWHNVSGPFLVWQGPVGVKEDGGGCTRGHGRVGNMIIHRAVCCKDPEGELRCLRKGAGSDQNERQYLLPSADAVAASITCTVSCVVSNSRCN